MSAYLFNVSQYIFQNLLVVFRGTLTEKWSPQLMTAAFIVSNVHV